MNISRVQKVQKEEELNTGRLPPVVIPDTPEKETKITEQNSKIEQVDNPKLPLNEKDEEKSSVSVELDINNKE